MERAFKKVRKWFAGLGTVGMAVAAGAAFFGFFGLVGGSVLPLVLGAAVFAGWWFYENATDYDLDA